MKQRAKLALVPRTNFLSPSGQNIKWGNWTCLGNSLLNASNFTIKSRARALTPAPFSVRSSLQSFSPPFGSYSFLSEVSNVSHERLTPPGALTTFLRASKHSKGAVRRSFRPAPVTGHMKREQAGRRAGRWAGRRADGWVHGFKGVLCCA